MGQKIHPVGFRIPFNKDWSSCWFASGRDFSRMLWEDLQVRSYLTKKLAHAAVARVVIERPAKSAKVTVFCARPGVAIGKKGEDHDKIKAEIHAILKVPVHITIEEVRKPELDAQLVADSIAQQLERRVMFRRAMKRAIQNAMRLGAIGVKVAAAGRLNGIEIARTEWYREGRVPLQTIRADVSYALSEAKTTYGVIGVKVWIYKGDIHILPGSAHSTVDPKEVVEETPVAPVRRRVAKKDDGTSTSRSKKEGSSSDTEKTSRRVKKEEK